MGTILKISTYFQKLFNFHFCHLLYSQKMIAIPVLTIELNSDVKFFKNLPPMFIPCPTSISDPRLIQMRHKGLYTKTSPHHFLLTRRSKQVLFSPISLVYVPEPICAPSGFASITLLGIVMIPSKFKIEDIKPQSFQISLILKLKCQS